MSATCLSRLFGDDIEEPGINSRYKDGIMQQPPTLSLPKPDAESAMHGERVAEFIRDRIHDAGGQISFAEYMHHCLYAPGLGYYAAGSAKFGSAGDFVTAPETSSLFGAILARQCVEVLAQLESPAILEIGAGSGKLAADILRVLAESGGLPEKGYKILEVSADLRERQESYLGREFPELLNSIEWLDALPADFSGVVVANEVLDALPVERFIRREQSIAQICVAADGDDFVLNEREAPGALAAAVENIEAFIGYALPTGYASEVCVAAPQWIADIAAALSNGAAFLFDYGTSRREYYAADRSGGWLRCHFRHHAHDNPLILPGIQDLTSWVDFTAVAEAAVDNGLGIAGYVPQARFLIAGGLDKCLADFSELPTDAQLKLSAEIKLLTLPAEMGENFKCLGLSRGDLQPPSAFEFGDRTTTLG
jgi:SAM-dependent MidA family methyltransferase